MNIDDNQWITMKINVHKKICSWNSMDFTVSTGFNELTLNYIDWPWIEFNDFSFGQNVGEKRQWKLMIFTVLTCFNGLTLNHIFWSLI